MQRAPGQRGIKASARKSVRRARVARARYTAVQFGRGPVGPIVCLICGKEYSLLDWKEEKNESRNFHADVLCLIVFSPPVQNSDTRFGRVAVTISRLQFFFCSLCHRSSILFFQCPNIGAAESTADAPGFGCSTDYFVKLNRWTRGPGARIGRKSLVLPLSAKSIVFTCFWKRVRASRREAKNGSQNCGESRPERARLAEEPCVASDRSGKGLCCSARFPFGTLSSLVPHIFLS